MESILSSIKNPDTFSACQFAENAARGIETNAFPSSLVYMVGVVVKQSLEDRRDLETSLMPDEWLDYVAKTFVFSKAGLMFLIRRLENQGHVSIQDALEWVVMERQAALEYVQAPTDKFSRRYAPGATALFKRLHRENACVSRSSNPAVQAAAGVVAMG